MSFPQILSDLLVKQETKPHHLFLH